MSASVRVMVCTRYRTPVGAGSQRPTGPRSPSNTMRVSARGQRPRNVALPGPCSRNDCTPVLASSVRNTSANRSCSRSRPPASVRLEAVVDRPLGERLARRRRPRRARRPTRAPRRGPRPRATTRSTRPMRSASSARDLPAGEDDVLGARRTDQARQPLRAAAAGDDAEQDLGLAELGVVGGDAEVARERELAPAAERVAVDRGDHRPRDARPRASSASRKLAADRPRPRRARRTRRCRRRRRRSARRP